MKQMEIISVKKDIYADWLLNKHYAKRLCSVSYAFGLYLNKEIKGVITFGMPPSPTLAKSICGEEFKKDVLELNRLVTNDDLPKNTLSQFVSKSIKLLPQPKIIVSFADANVGHAGYIYQATNFIYTGQSSNTKQWVDKYGKEFHFRNIGHYQKNNKLNVKLVKRRSNETDINYLEIANYLRNNRNGYKVKDIDKHFGYKDTAAHWFRTDKSGFSYPSVDDWLILKKILNFDDTYDNLMTQYKMVADPQEIIKKLGLKQISILGKHRYIYFSGNKTKVKKYKKSLKLIQHKYPK